jgi:prepilin-type N-terminal cleavage/methylation domain-containing protein
MRVEVHRGMTLVEVILALVLAGLVLTDAARLMTGIADGAERSRRSASAMAQSAIPLRLLRLQLRNAEPTAEGDTLPTFTGDTRSAAFVSTCSTPKGWVHRCQSHVTVDSARDGWAVRLEFDGRSFTPIRHTAPTELRYLDHRGESHSLAESWNRRSLPRAMAVLSVHDTLFLPVGEGR